MQSSYEKHTACPTLYRHEGSACRLPTTTENRARALSSTDRSGTDLGHVARRDSAPILDLAPRLTRLKLPLLFTPPSPTRPWVCHKLCLFRVLLRNLSEEPGAIQQVFGRFVKIRRLEELHLCTMEKRYGFGLDRRIPLGMDLNEDKYAGGE